VLRLATGVRESVLARVPSERARYTSMGGVVVGTAIMAMLSMSAALAFVFGGFRLFIVFAVPVWGLFILSLDRWLMSSTTMGDGVRSGLKLLARVVLSVALGVVLAEPLLLGIYGTAIEERIARDRQAELTTTESNLQTCNPIPGTPQAASGVAATPRCDGLRLAVAVESPDALQKQLDAAKQQAGDLQTTVTKDAAAYADLQAKARKECNGTAGPEFTGEFGEGPNCKALRAEAARYRADHQIEQNGTKLSDLNEQIAELTNRLGDARVSYGDAVTKAIDKELVAVSKRHGDIGLLERFRALDDLVSENAYVAVTEWAIRIFFVLVDALPIILKALSGRTAYDRMLDEQVGAQEHDMRVRMQEERRWSRESAELIREQTENYHQNERDLLAESSRVQRANLDERNDLLTDALEQHYMRTAIGPSNRGWVPNQRVMDAQSVASHDPTQELFAVDEQGRER
jgi:hypothetical protein